MTLLLLVTCGIVATLYIPSAVVSQQQPYFFNYQQPQIQTGSYQPFSNSPLGSYYQPNVNSPPPGQGSPSDPYQNFYSTQPQSQETGTITYPTEVISPTVSSSPLNSDNSNSLFQNFGNGLHQHQQPQQQHPTASSPAVSNGFRPSIPFFNHHTHIVNGLPRQQFFGNNYEFFRQRHHQNTFPDPLYQGHLNGPSTATPATVKIQSSTPLYVGGSSTASSVKSFGTAKETKPSYIAQSKPSSPPSTQAQNLLTNFPRISVSTASTLSSVTPTAKPLASSSSFVTPSSNSLATGSPSPTFAYSQSFPDRNSKTLKPLFGEEDDVEDAFGNANGNFGNSLSLTPRRSPLFSSGNDFSTFQNQKPSLASGSDRPTKVHTTTPIRIVFNYEQALEALQQEPGVRVIISQTEKPELTTSAYPSPSAYQSPISSTTTRTTPRPFRPSPLISSTVVPSSTPRYTYSPVNVPYSSTSNSEVDQYEDEVDEEDDRRTTAAKLESLALELEQGKFNYLSNNYNNNRGIASARPTYQTATSPLPPQNDFQTFQRGGKKFVKVPSPDSIYRDPEPRVVVNDLANILVHTVPPGQGQTSFPDYGTPAPRTVAPPSRTTQHLSKYSFPKFKTAKVTKLPDPSLRDEIDNLNQELTRQRFSPSSTTPLPRSRSTQPPPPPPPPAFPSPTSAFRARPVQTTQQPLILSVTTYRPPVDFSPKGFEDLDDSSEEKETEVAPSPPPRPPPSPTTRRPPTVTRITSESPMFQTPRYYYNNRERGGVVRVVPQEESQKNRYGFNDLDDQNENPPQKRKNVKVLRRQRPRPRVPSPSPETVQVPTTSIPLVEEGFPQQLHLGPVISPVPVPAAPPVPPVANGPQVLRVGPRGRLLRRKIRPRPQPGPQEITGEPGFVSSTPFGIATSEPFVTTFRPVTSNALIDQNAKDDDRVVVNGPFRSRFRFQPQQQQVQEDENDSESDEGSAPAPVPQRRRPSFSTTTTTESSPSAPVVASDRANILQRQIRFNRNRKNQRNNNNNN